MKLTTSNTFRLHLIEKNDWGGLMKGWVIQSDWYLTDTEHSPLPIPELTVYIFS